MPWKKKTAEPEEEEEQQEEKSKKKTDRFIIAQVATQTESVLVDNKEDKTYSTIEFLAYIGNKLDELEKILS